MMHGIARIWIHLTSVIQKKLIYTGQVNLNQQEDDQIINRNQLNFLRLPDNHIDNDPYKILFGQDDWTCYVANFIGTFKGPMKGFDGKTIEPTNKKFQIEFCTVAHWKNEEIVEEKLFYDLVGLMKQIGAL